MCAGMGCIWYSPTIFLGPLAFLVKRASGCRGYLILRDIFPSGRSIWGRLRRGPIYGFKIGGALSIFRGQCHRCPVPVELPLLRGMGEQARAAGRGVANRPVVCAGCRVLRFRGGNSLDMGRTIFVYAETWASPRGWIFFCTWPHCCANARTLVSCLSGVAPMCRGLRALATQRALDNVVFRDEVEPGRGSRSACAVPHRPGGARSAAQDAQRAGKVPTYMYAGLPVLARMNPGNDLADLIDGEDVGRVYVGDSPDALGELAVALADDPAGRARMARKAQILAEREFSRGGCSPGAGRVVPMNGLCSAAGAAG